MKEIICGSGFVFLDVDSILSDVRFNWIACFLRINAGSTSNVFDVHCYDERGIYHSNNKQ